MMKTKQTFECKSGIYRAIRILFATRLWSLCLLLLLLVFLLPMHVNASGPTSNPKGRSFDIGDPVAANTGGFYWKKRLLNLGGILPLTFDVSHYMNDHVGEGRLYINLENTSFSWENEGKKYVQFDLGIREELPLLVYSTALGYYREDYYSSSGRAYVMKETDGYYFLLDPIDELVYIFEKVAGEKSRLKWLCDRNNSLTYTYEQENDTRPLVVCERDGLAGNRMLYISRTQEGDQIFTIALEMIWVDDELMVGEKMCGLTELVEYYGPYLARAVDSLHGQTNFTWNGAWPPYIKSVTLPRGNTPYTQTAEQREYFGGSTNVLLTSQTDAYANTTTLSYGSKYSSKIVENRPDGTSVTYDHADKYTPPVSYTDTTGKQATFTDDALCRLTSMTDRLGDQTSLAYHSSAKLASVTNARGDSINNTYTPQDQTFATYDGEQATLTFHNLTRVDYPDGTNEQFSYDGHGNPVTRIDRSGQTWTYTYNDRGQVLTAANPAGGVSTSTYNADGTLASRTDSDTYPYLTTHAYDKHKRVVAVTHPGGTMQMTYDLNDQITSITDERNNTTQYAYDENGNLTTVTAPTGVTGTYAYDLMDRVSAFTNYAGNTTSYGYDALGRTASVTDPNGNLTQFGYNPRGWMNQRTDPAGHIWQNGYDDEGMATSNTTPSGCTADLGYDALGHLTSITDPLGHQGAMARDSMTRVTETRDPLDRTTTSAYSGDDLLTGVTLPNGASAGYQYGALGALSQISDLNGQVWKFVYTLMGRLASLTDPLDRQRQLGYDARGLLATVTYPDGGTQSLRYDPTGNLTQAEYAGGPTLNYAYDQMNRMTTANDITFGYNAVGQVISTRDSDGIDFGATYDNAGRLLTATYNDSELTVTYQYDARNLLTGVSDNLSGAHITFAYDTDGRLTGVTRSNGVNAAFTWDAASQLTRLQEGDFLDLQFTYNAAGEICQTQMTAPLDPGAALPSETAAFTVDAASQINSHGYAYDERGHITACPERTYSWNNAGRLVQIEEGGVTTELGYNGLGDLRLRSRSGEVRKYYYNGAVGLHPIMAKRDHISGKMLRFYVYTPAGQLLYMIDHKADNTVYFYHFDQVGSTLALTDAAGAVTDAYAYTPTGNLLAHTGESAQPFTFVGQWGVRQETGDGNLYYMRARYYDADTTRFLSRDPVWPNLADPRELNPYQYASNNPVSFVDPSGEWSKPFKVVVKLAPEVQGSKKHHFAVELGEEQLINWRSGTYRVFHPVVSPKADLFVTIKGYIRDTKGKTGEEQVHVHAEITDARTGKSKGRVYTPTFYIGDPLDHRWAQRSSGREMKRLGYRVVQRINEIVREEWARREKEAAERKAARVRWVAAREGLRQAIEVATRAAERFLGDRELAIKLSKLIEKYGPEFGLK